MLTCVACSGARSILEPPEDDGVNPSTPSTKQVIKALTAQIKGMVVKASVAYKSCRPCSGSLRTKRSREYMGSEPAQCPSGFTARTEEPAAQTPHRGSGGSEPKLG